MNTARDMACDHLNCPASYPRSTAPHSVECDKLTAAIEADRSQRAGLDPAARELLGRWLVWPGRSNDEPTDIELETAKFLGHADECEQVEYGVCTCSLTSQPGGGK